MRIMDLVTREERPDANYTWYAADPDVVYPEALAYLAEVCRGERSAPPSLAQYVAQAQALDLDVWALALTPRHLVAPADVAPRAEALELARLVATELLHAANGYSPIGVHWLKREAWRL